MAQCRRVRCAQPTGALFPFADFPIYLPRVEHGVLVLPTARATKSPRLLSAKSSLKPGSNEETGLFALDLCYSTFDSALNVAFVGKSGGAPSHVVNALKYPLSDDLSGHCRQQRRCAGCHARWRHGRCACLSTRCHQACGFSEVPGRDRKALEPPSRQIASLFSPDCHGNTTHVWDRSSRTPSWAGGAVCRNTRPDNMTAIDPRPRSLPHLASPGRARVTGVSGPERLIC
jgi:hypothetical protein